jgi:hypothetical protein
MCRLGRGKAATEQNRNQAMDHALSSKINPLLKPLPRANVKPPTSAGLHSFM